jgi:hypothetical protein
MRIMSGRAWRLSASLTKMPRSKQAPVVASRRVPELLRAIGFGGDLERALDVGAVERKKIVGRWLYFEPYANLDRVIEDVRAAAEKQVQAWLLAPTNFLRFPIAKALNTKATACAVEAILPELIRTRRFGALGLLTANYQPYLAIHSWEDEKEIVRQIRAMTEFLDLHGSVRQSALPEPARPRDQAGWKSSILKHGEFLGLGRMEDAALIRWRE